MNDNVSYSNHAPVDAATWDKVREQPHFMITMTEAELERVLEARRNDEDVSLDAKILVRGFGDPESQELLGDMLFSMFGDN